MEPVDRETSPEMDDKTITMFTGKIINFFLLRNIHNVISLKALDNFGNCQRPVFSLCVSQHILENYFLENYVTSDRAVSHDLSIVFTAFKGTGYYW